MYSLEQRKRAVEPCIKYGLKATAAIRELGYPSRAQLASWHREWQENGGRLADRSLGQCTLEQKRAAVRHCLTHGRCNALARRELGCPKRTAKLAEWTGEYAPGGRRATQPRVFDASEKAAAVMALASRSSSAQEVADLAGCTRSALYKWKRELLGEETPMSEDRPSKPARTRGRPPATQADIAALEARKAELEAELEELELRRDIMEGALEILGKGTGADPENELTNREKTLLIESLRPRWRLCELLSALGMARSSYQYQQGALRAPDRDEEARRRISEVFDANDGIYGRRRIHDEPEAGGRDHRGAQDRPHHGRGGARGPGQDEAKAAPRLLRGRDNGTSGKQGQAGLRGGASQLPVARGRDAVLDPRRQALPLPCPGLLRRLHRELDDVGLAERRDGQLDAGSSHQACQAQREGPPHHPQRLRMPLPVARVDIGLRGGGNHPLDVQEGPLSRQLPHGGLLRHHEERDALRKGLGGRQPGGAREEDR